MIISITVQGIGSNKCSTDKYAIIAISFLKSDSERKFAIAKFK